MNLLFWLIIILFVSTTIAIAICESIGDPPRFRRPPRPPGWYWHHWHETPNGEFALGLLKTLGIYAAGFVVVTVVVMLGILLL